MCKSHTWIVLCYLGLLGNFCKPSPISLAFHPITNSYYHLQIIFFNMEAVDTYLIMHFSILTKLFTIHINVIITNFRKWNKKRVNVQDRVGYKKKIVLTIKYSLGYLLYLIWLHMIFWKCRGEGCVGWEDEWVVRCMGTWVGG